MLGEIRGAASGQELRPSRVADVPQDDVLEPHQSQRGSRIPQPLVVIHQQPGDQTVTPVQENNLTPSDSDTPDTEQEESCVYATETVGLCPEAVTIGIPKG